MTSDVKTLLITGGAGFIGSHTSLLLLEAGHKLIILDNYANSSPESLHSVIDLAGPANAGHINIVEGDIRNPNDLERAFRSAPGGGHIDAVIHFAGLKSVHESVRQPINYWDVNLGGSRQLLTSMQTHNCRTIVFSSSATVYGLSEKIPIPETAPIRPINPYGNSKAAAEQLLADIAASEPGWRIACLRYFNPVGAHFSGRIGESPRDTPNNLFPIISKVADGKLKKLFIYGDDWNTLDGTGVRDYIHVMDLAEGHLSALDYLFSGSDQVITFNLGSGIGHSVLEVVQAFQKVTGVSIPIEITKRREGDCAISIADPSKAFSLLNWQPKKTLEQMCVDGWRWQANSKNSHEPA